MAIIYLLPSAYFGEIEIHFPTGLMVITGADTYYGAVNDPINVPDDDISYLGVTNGSDDAALGCYLPADFSAKSIEYVRFWLRGARTAGDDRARVKLNYGTHTKISIESYYPDYVTQSSAIFYNNPVTGQPWTEADLNPIIIDIALKTTSGGGIKYPSRATQAYVEVSYDPLELNGNGAFLLSSLNQ